MVITSFVSLKEHYVRHLATLFFVGQAVILNFMTTDVCHLDVQLVMGRKSSDTIVKHVMMMTMLVSGFLLSEMVLILSLGETVFLWELNANISQQQFFPKAVFFLLFLAQKRI